MTDLRALSKIFQILETSSTRLVRWCLLITSSAWSGWILARKDQDINSRLRPDWWRIAVITVLCDSDPSFSDHCFPSRLGWIISQTRIQNLGIDTFCFFTQTFQISQNAKKYELQNSENKKYRSERRRNDILLPRAPNTAKYDVFQRVKQWIVRPFFETSGSGRSSLTQSHGSPNGAVRISNGKTWENLSVDDTLFSGEQGVSVPREYLRKTLEMWSVFRRQLPRYFAFTVILYISNISRSCLSRHWPIVSFSEFCASWSKFGSYFHLWATGTHENTLKSIVRPYYTTR